jgi:hypothetical protein
MNENTPRSRIINEIANELCSLYQQQVDTLQQGTLVGLAEGELKQYSQRKQQVHELHMALKTLRLRPSQD